MTLNKKLDEKLKRLDELGDVLDEWIEVYHCGTTFPENSDMNSNTFKLNIIKDTVTEMIVVAWHAETLEEIIEEVKEC